ncbi:hypothetical protein ACIPPM_03000 [Streptomyces sp. NPDC090119]
MAWALDGLIGEVVAEHLVPDTAAVVDWLERLPGPWPWPTRPTRQGSAG